MPGPASEPAAVRPVDIRALQRVRARLQASAAPWLHEEAARRLAERLAIVRLQPATVLDWWSRIGGGSGPLRAAYPQARIVAVERDGDLGPPAGGGAAPLPWWRRWLGADARAVVGESAVVDGAAQLVWANMGLHGEPDPRAAMARWHRALAVDGFLMFTTLGPGSLPELRAAYAAAGWPSPLAPFVDMHDLGDMLVEAGFADPVMDQELVTLHWPDPAGLARELRTLGGNVDPARAPGLRTPRWRERLLAALAGREGARPSLTFELVYGHAVKPVPRARVQPHTAIGLDDMRAMVAARRR